MWKHDLTGTIFAIVHVTSEHPFKFGALGSRSAGPPLSLALMIETETVWETSVYMDHLTQLSAQGDHIKFSCLFSYIRPFFLVLY
jgi:hypothetical protein